MPNPQTFHFKLPTFTGAPLPLPPSRRYPGVEAVVPKCTSDRAAQSDGRIRAIVIHATAGSTSSGAMSNTFELKSSFHFLVPGERDAEHGSTIFQCMPEDRAAWHVRNSASHPSVNSGSRFVNYWSLGIEVVNSMKNNDPYSNWQVEQTAALVRYAWAKYPTVTEVVSHAKLDPSRRTDPGALFPWDRFREAVLAPSAAPMEFAASVGAGSPVRIVDAKGAEIDCDPRLLDGVTVAEVRPLVESLGFTVTYDESAPMTMRIARRRREA